MGVSNLSRHSWAGRESTLSPALGVRGFRLPQRKWRRSGRASPAPPHPSFRRRRKPRRPPALGDTAWIPACRPLLRAAEGGRDVDPGFHRKDGGMGRPPPVDSGERRNHAAPTAIPLPGPGGNQPNPKNHPNQTNHSYKIPSRPPKTAASNLGLGLRGFRLSPERRRGWAGGYVDSGCRRKDGGDGVGGYVDSGCRRKDGGDGWGLRGFRLSPERRWGWGGGYVDSGCRRKDGGDGWRIRGAVKKT